jgi:hypothetical protein
MRRAAGERMGGSARVFVRPVAMLAIGLAAGVAMWRVLMRGTFEATAGRGAIGAAAGPPNRLAESVSVDRGGH